MDGAAKSPSISARLVSYHGNEQRTFVAVVKLGNRFRTQGCELVFVDSHYEGCLAVGLGTPGLGLNKVNIWGPSSLKTHWLGYLN